MRQLAENDDIMLFLNIKDQNNYLLTIAAAREKALMQMAQTMI
jgi:hypothetical protein